MNEKQIDILNGNELIVRGGIEAGFSLYTGYPGSPLADYFNILHSQKKSLEEKGIKVVIANSEANAAAMASGAKQAGRDCLVAMKSMGLHVASDALSVGNFADPGQVIVDPETGEETKAGVVIAVGDDPWSMSTSTPADSRYLFKHLHIPFLEPSTPQELKDWMKEALVISRQTGLYQGLLLTTFMAEGGGRVELGQEAVVEREKVTLDPATFNLTKNVMVPPNSYLADVAMINERFPKIQKVYAKRNLDKIFGQKDSKIGVISSGVIFETLKQVMEEYELLSTLSLYKLASSYPLVEESLLGYLKNCETVIVVEEKRSFLETELREFVGRHQLPVKIYGKSFVDQSSGFPADGGLSFEIIEEKLLALLHQLSGAPHCERHQRGFEETQVALPLRLPTFCPGCPHRETLSLLKDLRRTLKAQNIDLITHGDVGCYSLSFLPPFKEMHNLSAMGQGGALGAGLDLFSENPSVVLMGDSTFFHSGMTDISNSVQCGHQITYILLDNDNTAMTGHQMTPRSGLSVDGHQRPEQDMLHLVKALGVNEVIEVNPSDRYFYRSLLKDYVSKPGVKVIVSKKECALTFHGRRKARERKDFSSGKTLESQTFFQINTDACEDCRVCVQETGCPGLTQVFDAYGSKVAIDPQICVADSYCTKMKVCPSFEQITVKNYHPTKYQLQKTLTSDEIELPVIKKSFDDIASGNDWRVVVTGVGGSGVTTISRVLSQAAKSMGGRMDCDFKFVDQKGLAQRNGNVTAHLAIYPKEKSYGAITPIGSADLLLSPDLLDGAKHLRFLSTNGELILDEKYQTPLTLLLDDAVEKAPLTEKQLRDQLEKQLLERQAILPLKKLSELALGKAVYASAMILGVAFQKGLLPFSLSDLKEAFSLCMKKEEEASNWQAFQLGRRLIVQGSEVVLGDYLTHESRFSHFELLKQSLKESCGLFDSQKDLMAKYEEHHATLVQLYPDLRSDDLAHYVHDLLVFDRGASWDEYLNGLKKIASFYSDRELKQIAVRTFTKTYVVKDEVFVAHLMISPMQRHRDQELYDHLGTKVVKKRMNRPQISLLGFQIEPDINPKDWMLRIVRHMRILRTLLPSWHQKEKEIALKTRRELLKGALDRASLKKCENIKGYRQVRYQKALEV